MRINVAERLVCGRWILDPAKAEAFEYSTNGQIIIDEPNAADSQGGFPVGADCARLIRRAIKEAK